MEKPSITIESPTLRGMNKRTLMGEGEYDKYLNVAGMTNPNQRYVAMPTGKMEAEAEKVITRILKENPKNVQIMISKLERDAVEHPNLGTRKFSQYILDKINNSSERELRKLMTNFTWK